MLSHSEIIRVLGPVAENLLSHECQAAPRTLIESPSPYHVEGVFRQSDRSEKVIANLHKLYGSGTLADTGYLSIFPVDQGIEHTAGYSFARNPAYFDPENIVKLAIAAGCNGVTSTLGVLGLVSGRYADKVPFIVKLNHNELLTYPLKHDEVMFASVKQAAEMGAVGVGATIYFGSPESNRQIQEVSQAFELAHKLGLLTILWCYPRNSAFVTTDANYEESADITGQAIHLGVTIEADIIKQKLPTSAGGMRAVAVGKYTDETYQLIGNHPIDWVRYQVLNSYAGKISVINSGGEYTGANDLQSVVQATVINKRGGGAGMITGRKIFNRPVADGVALMQAVQSVYLDKEITVA
jgi:class I fructose-bisphosphate aldolase